MPNTVVKLINAESTWLEAAWEDRKLLIKKERDTQKCVSLFVVSAWEEDGREGDSRMRAEKRLQKWLLHERVPRREFVFIPFGGERRNVLQFPAGAERQKRRISYI